MFQPCLTWNVQLCRICSQSGIKLSSEGFLVCVPQDSKFKMLQIQLLKIDLFFCAYLICKFQVTRIFAGSKFWESSKFDCVRNTQIHEMTNTQPLINTVKQHQPHFIGHILRMLKDEPCRRYAVFVPVHVRSRPGRQRTSYMWLSYLQKLLGDTKNHLQGAICRFSYRPVYLEKICSCLLCSQVMIMMRFDAKFQDSQGFSFLNLILWN